jgi:hypothetical protein
LGPVSPVIGAVTAKEADGLSRDAEDCNMGCIDNGR